MATRSTLLHILGAALGGMMLPAPAQGQQIPAACRPLLEAQRKVILTPHHSYQSDGPATGKASRATGELISTAEATYVLYRGTWKRSPMTPRAALAQFEENIANARNLACQRVGEESVGGVRAIVYTSHSESEDARADGRIWVGVSSGLVLRSDQDIDSGGGDRRHLSIRYEYDNVHPPAGLH